MSTSAAYKQNVVGGKLKLKRPLGATSSGATAAHTTRRAAPTSTSSKPAPGSTETLQRAATEQAERKEQEASDGRPGDDERAGSGKRHKTEAVQVRPISRTAILHRRADCTLIARCTDAGGGWQRDSHCRPVCLPALSRAARSRWTARRRRRESSRRHRPEESATRADRPHSLYVPTAALPSCTRHRLSSADTRSHRRANWCVCRSAGGRCDTREDQQEPSASDRRVQRQAGVAVRASRHTASGARVACKQQPCMYSVL